VHGCRFVVKNRHALGSFPDIKHLMLCACGTSWSQLTPWGHFNVVFNKQKWFTGLKLETIAECLRSDRAYRLSVLKGL
jgi:hypothetical protein